MKFIDLKKNDINRNDAYKKFEEELNKFKLKYDNKFELDYYSVDELVVTIDQYDVYSEDMHNDLCETFDVRLQYVCKSIIQNHKTSQDKIEFIYSPVHHYVTYIEWEDIEL